MNDVHDGMVVGRPQTRADRLDQEAIVAAASWIARTSGIDALTMRTLTAELQVSVGACYNHVRNRDELLNLVADDVLRQAPSLRGDVGDPWEAITQHTIGIQSLLDDYPGLDIVVMRRAPHSAVSKEVRSDFVRLMVAHGLSSADAQHVLRSVTWLWLGARISLGGRRQKPRERTQFARALDEMIASLRTSLTADQGDLE